MGPDFILISEHRAVLKAAQQRYDSNIARARNMSFWAGVAYAVTFGLFGVLCVALLWYAGRGMV